jgi:hypothetical protein
MPVQSLTAVQCQNGDRFIPHRYQSNRKGFRCTKKLAETMQEEDILKQVTRCNLDISLHYEYLITTQYPLLKIVLIQEKML